MPTYRRRLPHIQQIGEPLFVTWRLADSLPANRSFRRDDLTDGQAFVVFDNLLDTARVGPYYLVQPRLAEMVTTRVVQLSQQDEMYALHAFAVMPNHVHLLLTPNSSFPHITKLIKGVTARQANLLLGTTGKAFWQDESYDHRVRDNDEYSRIRRYIEFNPVRAGLAPMPESYPYSSASPRWNEVSAKQERG